MFIYVMLTKYRAVALHVSLLPTTAEQLFLLLHVSATRRSHLKLRMSVKGDSLMMAATGSRNM
jgi:hypothetical protein